MLASTIIEDEKQLQILLGLLEGNNLPFKDIVLQGHLFKIYRNKEDAAVGSGGLEFYGQFALLRSVSVVQAARGKSIGTEIVKDLLQNAKDHAIRSVYLLTETAPVFFERLGFTKVARELLPDPVKASTEFSSVCPVSATCMEFKLDR